MTKRTLPPFEDQDVLGTGYEIRPSEGPYNAVAHLLTDAKFDADAICLSAHQCVTVANTLLARAAEILSDPAISHALVALHHYTREDMPQ